MGWPEGEFSVNVNLTRVMPPPGEFFLKYRYTLEFAPTVKLLENEEKEAA